MCKNNVKRGRTSSSALYFIYVLEYLCINYLYQICLFQVFDHPYGNQERMLAGRVGI